jgi:hypothetical protein
MWDREMGKASWWVSSCWDLRSEQDLDNQLWGRLDKLESVKKVEQEWPRQGEDVRHLFFIFCESQTGRSGFEWQPMVKWECLSLEKEVLKMTCSTEKKKKSGIPCEF